MSGLEIVGIAASIIQIADLGTKLSVKLFSFYRQIQNANQAIQHLSSDIALTCAILRELGDSLKQDETSKLCSPEAHLTARQMLKQCEQVLRQIQTMIDESHTSGKSRWQQATSKIRNVLNEPDINRMRENLERLKSTMLLLLNVIMFAGQIRHNHIPEMLNEQRNLIEILLKEKAHVKTAHVETIDSNPTICLASLPQAAKPAISFQKNSLTVSDQELQDYNSLIRAMLREIDGCKSKLEMSRHSRIRDGVLNVHSSEIVHFQRNYGSSVFQYFDDSIFDDSSVSQPVTTGNLDISPDPLPENDSKRPKYDHVDSYFSPLCSPAVRPHDFQAADLSGLTFSDLSVSQRAVRPEQRPRISPNLRPLMDYRDNTPQDSLFISTKTKYEQIINGTQIPGVSYPTITSTGLSSKRTSHKIGEQGRRNRFSCAIKELKAFIPATFIRDTQNQTQASSCVETGEKEMKEISQTSSNAFLLEMAIHYIKEFQLVLKEPDPSVETDAHAKLSSEHDALEVSKEGPRRRINAALKEIESLIPSDLVRPRMVKDNAISEVKPESNTEKEPIVRARSKATIVEMTVDYIKEMQQNIKGTSDNLALRLLPPLAPSPDGHAEPSGKEQRSESTGGQDEPTQVSSRKPERPMIPTEEVALPAPRNPPSTGDPKLCEVETSQGDDLRERVCLPDAWEDIEAQTQRYKTHGSTTKIHQSSHKDGWSHISHMRKRKFSAVDTPSTAAMAFEPLIEDHHDMSESVKPEDSPLEVSSEQHSELFTDLSWPSSFEKALKRWTNLEQNEINMGMPGLITLGI